MNIIFDLDGVIRNLSSYLRTQFGVPAPSSWFWTHRGKNIFELIEEDDFNACLKSPPTKYYNIIKKYFPEPIIWSCQPIQWRPKTIQWLDNHFEDYTLRFLEGEEKNRRIEVEVPQCLSRPASDRSAAPLGVAGSGHGHLCRGHGAGRQGAGDLLSTQ